MFVNRVPSSVSSAVSVRPVQPVVPASAGEPGRPVASRRGTRRDVVRGLLASAVAVALTPVVAASRPPHPPRPARSEDSPFDEMYRGRHLLGAKTDAGRRAAAGGGEWQVTVDGRPLHLMRRADGTYLSMVDHYRSYPTALEAARAAVDELGPSEQLRGTDAEESAAEGSGHAHGVHP
ncbi:tyrosinase family oxidase copper chaperone [Streptomyces sp. NBC_00620]|uniref:tyrosinase family oxidase copper chaperone n=1 Tax=unclassified Streptomyces TaxID=2593676 RepID=UPI00224FD726|nr:tyrosinase family oxidase copper chaperone [Streptomyces sp. NBC_00620]MCX4974396.1 tyrosinase cofactor [Streptomyces sp. NBC_00620]WUC11336.1 tyrosinase cofactor [Streptomyces sp. NBC_00564]